MNDTSSVALVRSLGWEVRRGSAAMGLFIVTEAMLFVGLFFSYYYVGREQPRWPTVAPPKLTLALIMLVLLLVSSAVVEWGRRQGRAGRDAAARLSLVVTIGLGLSFLLLQAFEYRDHLRTLSPTQDSYGSIFYTITSVHGAHVILGLLMLAYVVILPHREPTERPPHRPHHNAAMYWHFVDGVWVIIVALLYVAPNIAGK